MEDEYLQGTTELVPLKVTKDKIAATNTSVTGANVGLYLDGTTFNGTYPVACVFSAGYWSFPINTLTPGMWHVRAQLNAPGENGVLLDCGTFVVVP